MTKFIIAIALALSASRVLASGLYDETQTPIAGEVVSYRRMPAATVSNTLGTSPSIQMTTETVELYPNGKTVNTFMRRVDVGYLDFIGKKYPLYNPSNGVQIGTVDGDMLYAIMYSTWILGEKKADSNVGTLVSNPAILCYTTHSTDTCILPETIQQ